MKTFYLTNSQAKPIGLIRLNEDVVEQLEKLIPALRLSYLYTNIDGEKNQIQQFTLIVDYVKCEPAMVELNDG